MIGYWLPTTSNKQMHRSDSLHHRLPDVRRMNDVPAPMDSDESINQWVLQNVKSFDALACLCDFFFFHFETGILRECWLGGKYK